MTVAEIIEKAKKDDAFRKELVIYAQTTKEGEEILNNFHKAEWEKKIGAETEKIYTGIDNDIFEATGKRKANNQRTFDFVKEIAKEYKTLLEGSKGDKDKIIADLQKKIEETEKGGVQNEFYKKLYEQVLADAAAKEKELNEKLTAKENEAKITSVKGDLMQGRAGLIFIKGLPQQAIDAMIKAEEEGILPHAKIVDGKVIYHNEKGEPLLNKQYQPITSKEIWAQKLEAVMDKGTPDPKKAGGGAPTTVETKVVTTGEGDNSKKKLVLDKTKFSTRFEFVKAAEKGLTESGFIVGSKEANALQDEAYKEYEVGALPFD